MARLPRPGGDANVWGEVLNEFLAMEHNADGSLKIRSDGTLSQYYTKPSSGIPSTDLASTVQTDLQSAASAIQQVNGHSGTSVTLSASDVGAPTTLSGDTDVDVSGASNGQVLTFNSGTHKWGPAVVTSTVVSDATTASKGIVQLAGDLSGNAAVPIVTGTHLAAPLPIAQGGTGSASQNFVDMSTNQTVSGVKTFTTAPVVPSNAFPESAVSGLVTDLASTEKVANKGGVNGYAPLDGNAEVPIANLPVGNSSTTLAAGNDSRITGAVQSINGVTATNGAVTLTPNDISSTIAVVALYSGGQYPTRSSITTNATNQTVIWLGPIAPPIGSGYAIDGLDIWDQTIS